MRRKPTVLIHNVLLLCSDRNFS